MRRHFAAHERLGERIPDVPIEPPVYAIDDASKGEFALSLAAKRRFERSGEQELAERWAWFELAVHGTYLRDEAALAAAGVSWLQRRSQSPSATLASS